MLDPISEASEGESSVVEEVGNYIAREQATVAGVELRGDVPVVLRREENE